MKKYYLGLDIGIASCGWGVISYDEKNKEWDLDDFGVRIWQTPETGNANDSNASFRRLKRAQRRLIQRRKARIKDLIKLVISENFLSETDFINDEKSDVPILKQNVVDILSLKVKGLTKKLTPNEIVAILINYAKNRSYNNEFEQEAKLLDEKKVIELEKKEKEEKLSPIDAYNLSINDGRKLIEKYKDNPYPSYIYFNDEHFKMKSGSWKGKIGFKNNLKEIKDKDGKKIRDEFPIHVVFERKHYIAELEKILSNQESYPFIKKNKEEIVKEIIFRQRFFEDGPGHKNDQLRDREKDLISSLMGPQSIFFKAKESKSIFEDKIGNCSFITDQKRYYRGSVLSDLYQILVVISQIANWENIDKEIIKNYTLKCFEHYFKELKITGNDFIKIAKSLGLTWVKYLEVKDINLLEKFKFINEKWFLNNLAKLDLQKLNSLEDSEFQLFSELIYQNRTPKKLKLELEKKFEFINDENFKDISLKINKISKKVLNVSKAHIINSIKKSLSDGIYLSKYQSDLNKENLDKKLKSLSKQTQQFSAIVDWDMIPNSTVFRALNQVRRICYALHKKYKHFDSIVIETAKQLYNDKKYRNEYQSNQKKNEELNNEARDFWGEVNLSNKGVILGQSSEKIIKYKLWFYQKTKRSDEFSIDPYVFDVKTKKFGQIKINDLKNGGFEKEHIIPYSKHNDNSLNNLVLSNSIDNKNKGNKTSFEYMKSKLKDDKSFGLWVNAIKVHFKDNEKKLNYLLCEDILALEKDFDSQNLNDTRYITKYIKDYLAIQLDKWNKTYQYSKTDLLTVNGKVTSQFRKLWLGSNKEDKQLNVWGKEKVRNITHYHHAIDAIVLANIIDESYNTFYTNMVKIKDLAQINNSKFIKKEINKADFIKSINELVDPMLKDFKHNPNIRGIDVKKEIEDFRKKIIFLIENDHKLYLKDIFKFIKPIVENLNEKIIHRIPIKLKLIETKDEKTNKVNEEIELKEVLTIDQWTKETGLSKKMFPLISYKINARVRGTFASQTIYKKNDKKVEKNPDSYTKIKSNGGFIKNDSYFGIFYNSQSKKLEQISMKEAQNNKKMLPLKRNKLFTWGVNFIDQDTNDIFYYKGLGGQNYQFEPKLNYSSNIKPNLKNRKILSNSSILNINILGKIEN